MFFHWVLHPIKGTESGFHASYLSISEVPVTTGHVLNANTGGAVSRLLIKTEDKFSEIDPHGLEFDLND